MSAARDEKLVHATCVALEGCGILLRGASGAGKSDLALRLLEAGASLVADDQTILFLKEGKLHARAPETIRGRMEVRGVGIVEADLLGLACLERVVVGLVVDCLGPLAPAAVERLPAGETCVLLGCALPLLRLLPFESSAPAKLRLAIRALGRGIMPAS